MVKEVYRVPKEIKEMAIYKMECLLARCTEDESRVPSGEDIVVCDVVNRCTALTAAECRKCLGATKHREALVDWLRDSIQAYYKRGIYEVAHKLQRIRGDLDNVAELRSLTFYMRMKDRTQYTLDYETGDLDRLKKWVDDDIKSLLE